MKPSSVALVGAGPGDPDLLTVKALRYLALADVVVYDRLVGQSILTKTRRDCELIYAGKRKHLHVMSQAQINQTLIHRARRGCRVVRLKGGDPFVFGRGGEEIAALEAAGVDYEVVPGITAASSAAASACLPLTHRDHAQALTLITAHRRNGKLEVDWELIMRPHQTVAIYMGLSVLQDLAQQLLEKGKAFDTKLSIISRASHPDQTCLHTTLGRMAQDQLQEIPAPAVLLMHTMPDRGDIYLNQAVALQASDFP